MIYKGKKQDDGTKTLGELEFKEGEFMVVMCAKRKKYKKVAPAKKPDQKQASKIEEE